MRKAIHTLPNLLQSMTAETLVVWGEKDVVVPMSETAPKSLVSLPSPQARSAVSISGMLGVAMIASPTTVTNIIATSKLELLNMKTLLVIFAHPDDESHGPGGTLSKYASEGVKVHYLCATRGEAGCVHNVRGHVVH